MSNKLNELRAFINTLRYPENGPSRTRISLSQIEMAIAENYGYSSYHLKGILNALMKFELIFEITPQIYSFEKPKPEPEEDIVPEDKKEEHLEALLFGSDKK